MKTSLKNTMRVAGLGLLVACLSHAAPSLPITKPPVGPTNILSGPASNPSASFGMAGFLRNPANGGFYENYFSREFHDDNGGISGRIVALPTDSQGYITGFTIRATVTNNNPPFVATYGRADNRQGESHGNVVSVNGTMKNVVICAEFSGTTGYFNNAGTWVSGDTLNTVVARNNNAFMYYNFSSSIARGYTVPGWRLGDIAAGASATVDMQFSIPVRLAPGTTLHNIFRGWKRSGADLLANRSSSLKISQYPVTVNEDFRAPTTASVFHQ